MIGYRALHPTARVELRVVDTSCRPVPGVELAFFDYDVRGTSDANGFVELTVPYEVPHYANLREPRGYAFLGDGMIVSVCQPEVSYTIVLRKPGELRAPARGSGSHWNHCEF